MDTNNDREEVSSRREIAKNWLQRHLNELALAASFAAIALSVWTYYVSNVRIVNELFYVPVELDFPRYEKDLKGDRIESQLTHSFLLINSGNRPVAVHSASIIIPNTNPKGSNDPADLCTRTLPTGAAGSVIEGLDYLVVQPSTIIPVKGTFATSISREREQVPVCFNISVVDMTGETQERIVPVTTYHIWPQDRHEESPGMSGLIYPRHQLLGVQ